MVAQLRKLEQMPSMAALVAEYRPAMDTELLHTWAHDIISSVVIGQARSLLKARYPNYSSIQLAELEDENGSEWKLMVRGAVESLPLNNFTVAELAIPLPNLYDHIQKISAFEE